MRSAPAVMTFREPYRSIKIPTSGETVPTVRAAAALPPAMAARLQPK